MAGTDAPRIVIVGAGINGLVAANYLQKAGCEVALLEQSKRVGGACISAVADIDGHHHHYALGASVLGLMQQFVFEQTGLSKKLRTFVPVAPKQVFFPGDVRPTKIHRDPDALDTELRRSWNEVGRVKDFRDDKSRVIEFLRTGYREARVPTLDEARVALGDELTQLWISGTARTLLNHYFSSELSKIYMAMTVTESGPVSLDAPYSAFTLPLMDSGSIFGGYYGFVKGGIWRVTEELETLNTELGVEITTKARVVGVDLDNRQLTYASGSGEHIERFDHLVFATDPRTAARLAGTSSVTRQTQGQQFRGSSGKLNLLFRNPVRWKNSDTEDAAAFRFIFAVNKLEHFEAATLAVNKPDVPYEPGYMQIYCEGAAMRHLNHQEPFDRLAVFFKNLSLSEAGLELPEVEAMVKQSLFAHIDNPQDCAWSRLLTPRDLQQLFHFPEGNIDHTMLIGGQTFAARTYSSDPDKHFYQFGEHPNVYLCGSGAYPCGSVTGTAGYMCSQQLLRKLDSDPGASRLNQAELQ